MEATQVSRETLQPAAAVAGCNIPEACSTLHAWLVATEENGLDGSIAQVTLRAVEEKLANWMDSPQAGGAEGEELMFGVNLVRLAEASVWNRLMVEKTVVRSTDDEVSVVRQALLLLESALGISAESLQ